MDGDLYLRVQSFAFGDGLAYWGIMPAAIGLFVYRFDVYPLNGREKVGFNEARLRLPPEDAIHAFVRAHKDPVVDEKDQRIWFFQDPILDGEGELDGYINYGTYGFESDFIDTKTKEKKYKRESHHYEDIPLFYQIWIPDNENYGLMLFQSFSGRSCSQKVRDRFRSFFMKANDGFSIRYRKLLPGDANGDAFAEAPITGLSFIKRRVAGDRFDDYGQENVPEEVEIEVSITARKKGSWGPFGKLDREKLREEASGVFLVAEERFDRAVASVRLGKKLRRVSVFGPKGEAGSIDITEDVEFLESGHPETKSLQRICNEVMTDFQKGL